MDNQEWAQILRRAVIDKSGGPSAVALPKERLIAFSGNREWPVISMKRHAIDVSNMQSNDAAFEAWAVALLTWGEAEGVHLSWEKPISKEPASRHFNRFMYRVAKFKELLGERVTLDDSEAVARHRECIEKHNPVLNVAMGLDTCQSSSPSNSEAEAEKWFKRTDNPARNKLMTDCGLVRLCRQFPVGLFRNSVKEGNQIFAAGKSAIDLIGLDHAGEIWLFELKVGSNIAIGALSELLFYSMVILDAKCGKFGFDGKASARAEVLPEDVKRTSQIHACILADRIHPLLSDGPIQMINDAFERRSWPVDLRYIPLDTYRQVIPQMA